MVRSPLARSRLSGRPRRLARWRCLCRVLLARVTMITIRPAGADGPPSAQLAALSATSPATTATIQASSANAADFFDSLPGPSFACSDKLVLPNDVDPVTGSAGLGAAQIRQKRPRPAADARRLNRRHQSLPARHPLLRAHVQRLLD